MFLSEVKCTKNTRHSLNCYLKYTCAITEKMSATNDTNYHAVRFVSFRGADCKDIILVFTNVTARVCKEQFIS